MTPEEKLVELRELLRRDSTVDPVDVICLARDIIDPPTPPRNSPLDELEELARTGADWTINSNDIEHVDDIMRRLGVDIYIADHGVTMVQFDDAVHDAVYVSRKSGDDPRNQTPPIGIMPAKDRIVTNVGSDGQFWRVHGES